MDRVDRKNVQDLKDAAFDVVLRGYDKQQVDERLRFLGSQLTAAENALRTATQRATVLDGLFGSTRPISGAATGPTLPKRRRDGAQLPQHQARTV